MTISLESAIPIGFLVFVLGGLFFSILRYLVLGRHEDARYDKAWEERNAALDEGLKHLKAETAALKRISKLKSQLAEAEKLLREWERYRALPNGQGESMPHNGKVNDFLAKLEQAADPVKRLAEAEALLKRVPQHEFCCDDAAFGFSCKHWHNKLVCDIQDYFKK